MLWTGPTPLQAMLKEFEDDEEIPVLSRVGQFTQRSEGRKPLPKPKGPAEPPTCAPTTPPTKTSPLKLSTKLDHQSAKQLKRAENMIGGLDATQRYLLHDLDKEVQEERPGSTSPSDSEKKREVLEDTVRQALRASWPEDRVSRNRGDEEFRFSCYFVLPYIRKFFAVVYSIIS